MTQDGKKTGKIQILISQYSIYFVLVVMIILASLTNDNFLGAKNISNIARQISVITIMSFGQTLVTLTGMIDLSVGSVMALAGVLSVSVYKITGSMLLAIVVGVLVGVVCSTINGLVVTKLSVPPFIATLGMLTAARGLALLYTKGQNIYQIGDYKIWGQGNVYGIPTPIIFMLAATVVMWYLLNNTTFGRYCYAIGGNEEAARASGVNVSKTKIMAYMVSGALVGLAGILFMSRVSSGLPNAGIGNELDTISNSVIGGASTAGGTGSAGGTLCGAFIIGILNNIMNLKGVSSYVQQVVRGVIIVLAVAYDSMAKKRRRTA